VSTVQLQLSAYTRNELELQVAKLSQTMQENEFLKTQVKEQERSMLALKHEMIDLETRMAQARSEAAHLREVRGSFATLPLRYAKYQ